jgi:hypothetical protein
MARTQKRSVTSTATAGSVAGNGKKNISSQEFNPDYTSIIKDLKKIGIMAVSFISILVVLSFIIK